MAYDYPGYGTSAGTASEERCYMSIQAAYDYLLQSQHALPQQIILYGRSLGSGPTSEFANNHPVGGVIYEGAFTSILRVPARINILPWDKFDNLSKIDKITVPILIIHGTKDGTVDVWHGKKLFAKANEPKSALWVEGAGHNDIAEVAGEKYFNSILEFSKKLSKTP